MSQAMPETIIRPVHETGRYPTLEKLAEIFQRRRLLYYLAVKELKIKYNHASLSFLWALVYPLVQMVIFVLVFSFVLRFGVENYPAFLLCGLVPWTFFNFSLNGCTNSITDNFGLIKKIYFPREILPFSKISGNLVDFLISGCVLLVFLMFFGLFPSRFLLFLPLALGVQLLFTAGVCLMAASLMVSYRDVNHVKDLLLMFWFYASPILYPVSKIPEQLSWIIPFYYMNPMAGIIHLYRAALYYQEPPSIPIVLYTSAFSLGTFWLGMRIFRRYDRFFADLV